MPSPHDFRLQDGTVIDHLPVGTAARALVILGLPRDGPGDRGDERAEHAASGTRTSSGWRGSELRKHETDRLALLGENGDGQRSSRAARSRASSASRCPERLVGVIRCQNPTCITNHERMSPVFDRVPRPRLKLRCAYCERAAADAHVFVGGWSRRAAGRAGRRGPLSPAPPTSRRTELAPRGVHRRHQHVVRGRPRAHRAPEEVVDPREDDDRARSPAGVGAQLSGGATLSSRRRGSARAPGSPARRRANARRVRRRGSGARGAGRRSPRDFGTRVAGASRSSPATAGSRRKPAADGNAGPRRPRCPAHPTHHCLPAFLFRGRTEPLDWPQYELAMKHGPARGGTRGRIVGVATCSAVRLIQLTPDLMLITDADGRIEYLNRAFGAASVGDQLGTSLFAFVSPSTSGALQSCLERVLAQRPDRRLRSGVDPWPVRNAVDRVAGRSGRLCGAV